MAYLTHKYVITGRVQKDQKQKNLAKRKQRLAMERVKKQKEWHWNERSAVKKMPLIVKRKIKLQRSSSIPSENSSAQSQGTLRRKTEKQKTIPVSC